MSLSINLKKIIAESEQKASGNHPLNDEVQKFEMMVHPCKKKMLISLQEYFKQIDKDECLIGCIRPNEKEIEAICDNLFQDFYEIFKAVQFAYLEKDADEHIILQDGTVIHYADVLNECNERFSDIVNDLVKLKIIPPIIPADGARQLFWSSDMGKKEANALAERENLRAGKMVVATDFLALKYFGRLVLGWRTEDLSNDYKIQNGNYLNVFYGLVNLNDKNPPFEGLRRFFWDAYSNVYVKEAKGEVRLIMQDALTKDNCFWRTELPNLRKENPYIILQKAKKVLDKLSIDLPLPNKKIQSIEIKEKKLNLILQDGTRIIFEKYNKKKYICSVLTRRALKEKIYLSNHGVLDLIQTTWNVAWEEKNLDTYSRIRDRATDASQVRLVKTKQGDLLVASVQPLNHAWIEAYLEKKAPIMGPLHFTKAFMADQKIESLEDKKNLFNLYLSELKGHLKDMIEAIHASPNDPNILNAEQRICQDIIFSLYHQLDALGLPIITLPDSHLFINKGIRELGEIKEFKDLYTLLVAAQISHKMASSFFSKRQKCQLNEQREEAFLARGVSVSYE